MQYTVYLHDLQAPAVDVIAIGLSDGRVVLHNIRYDETIVEFKQDWGPVTALTFRTGTIRFSDLFL